jgi:hypothetical protein
MRRLFIDTFDDSRSYTDRLCLSPAFTLVSCLAYSSTLKMEATCSSETSVAFQLTARRHIPEDITLHNHRCENLKFSYKLLIISYVPLYITHTYLSRNCGEFTNISQNSRSASRESNQKSFTHKAEVLITSTLTFGSKFITFEMSASVRATAVCIVSG